MSDKYVIFSREESLKQGEAMFWNNLMGWVSWSDEEGKDNPSVYTADETRVFHLPLATNEDADWITVEEAVKKIFLINADVLFNPDDLKGD